jgi:hypothetical protein
VILLEKIEVASTDFGNATSHKNPCYLVVHVKGRLQEKGMNPFLS